MEVRLKTLDGVWETVGVDRLTGIKPEGISASSNQHGSDTCRFILKRDPGALHPDLRAFTPCELLQGGKIVWSGRVWETPSKEGSDQQISVEGRGWQYHLDDTSFSLPYSRQRIDFKDLRSLPHAPLDYFTASGSVGDENGATIIGWQKDAAVTTSVMVGVRYDLGPEYENYWPEFFMRVFYNGDQTDIRLYVRTHNSEYPILTPPYGCGIEYTDLYTNYFGNIFRGQEEVITLLGALPRRYISVFLVYEGGGGTFGAEEIMHIRDFQVYAKPEYRGMTDKSHLRASDVIVDSIDRAAPLIKTPELRSTKFSDEILGNPTVAAYYRHDNQTGAIQKDYGPYGNDMNMTGTPTITSAAAGLDPTLGIEAGNIGMIYGGTQWGDAALSIAPTSRVSMMCVFKTTALPQIGGLVYVGNPVANGWGVFVGQHSGAASTLYLLRGGIAWTNTAITLTNNKWYLLTCAYSYGASYSGSLPTHYLNINIWDATGNVGSYSMSSPAPNEPANVFRVGGYSTSDEFTGYIDESALFYKPFNELGSAESVEALMAASAFAKTDGPVQRTGFWIPEFGMPAAQTPREAIDAVNVFHDYQWKVNHDPSIVYKTKPSVAKFEVGSWSGAQFEDASANAAEEIYNEVRVEATDVFGEAITVKRGGLQNRDTHGLSNGDFESGSSWWGVFSPGQSSLAASSTVAYEGTQSLAVSVTSAPHTPTAQTTSFKGIFVNGHIYRLVGKMYRTAAAANHEGEITIATNTETASKAIPPGGSGFWFPFFIDFRFTTFDDFGSGFDTPYYLQIQQQNNGTTGVMFYIDALEIHALDDSIPSRQGFIRSKTLSVNAALTQAAGERIADTWLAGRQTTPLKGALVHSSHTGVRELVTGNGVPPADMLNQTGEKILFSHRVDPDNGNWGRTGTIATVSYDETSGISSITIDSTRQDFEALLGRFAAVAGTIR